MGVKVVIIGKLSNSLKGRKCYPSTMTIWTCLSLLLENNNCKFSPAQVQLQN